MTPPQSGFRDGGGGIMGGIKRKTILRRIEKIENVGCVGRKGKEGKN